MLKNFPLPVQGLVNSKKSPTFAPAFLKKKHIQITNKTKKKYSHYVKDL